MDIDQLECPICSKIASNAFETQCCNNILCEECLTVLQNKNKECPLCRQKGFLKYRPLFAKELIAKPSLIMRKLIGNLKINCELCQFQTT